MRQFMKERAPPPTSERFGEPALSYLTALLQVFHTPQRNAVSGRIGNRPGFTSACQEIQGTVGSASVGSRAAHQVSFRFGDIASILGVPHPGAGKESVRILGAGDQLLQLRNIRDMPSRGTNTLHGRTGRRTPIAVLKLYSMPRSATTPYPRLPHCPGRDTKRRF